MHAQNTEQHGGIKSIVPLEGPIREELIGSPIIILVIWYVVFYKHHKLLMSSFYNAI